MDAGRMIPKTVKIGAYNVKVEFVENMVPDGACCGQYIPRTKTIQLDPGSCPEQQFGTLCHEIIEAFTEIYELPSLTENHHDIVLLGEALHALLRDNMEAVLPL